MADINFTAGREGLDFNSSVEAIIKRSCIVDFGIVQKVRDGVKGIVDVSLAVGRTKQDMIIMTCVLASIASASFAVDVAPNVGDRVLVVYPRLYDEKMFTVSDVEAEKTNIIINANARGYNLTAGIAILLNQYKENAHKNFLHIENGTVDLKLAFKNNDNLFTLTINADGEATLKSNGITVSMNKDNEVTVTTGKATVKIDKDGNVSIEAQGKYTIKNSSTDLQKVIDGLAQKLEQLITVGSPATQATSPATLSAIATWRTSILNQFFNVAPPPESEGE